MNVNYIFYILMDFYNSVFGIGSIGSEILKIVIKYNFYMQFFYILLN